MRKYSAAVIIFCLFLFDPAVGHALHVVKSLPHYVQEMEFFYQKPRPQIIDGLLRNLDNAGILAQSDKRLMVAAFLSELARMGKIPLEKLAAQARDKDLRHTLAWSLHLAQSPNEKKLMAQLLTDEDRLLARQIAASPAALTQWDILAEPSIVMMYWGAFMASGNQKWLDPIINAALAWASGSHRPNGPENVAAITLYEYAPRHALIRERLNYFVRQKQGAEKNMLNVMLQGRQ